MMTKEITRETAIGTPSHMVVLPSKKAERRRLSHAFGTYKIGLDKQQQQFYHWRGGGG
jgi:hypothetical protein